MGIVFLAEDRRTHLPVAAKVMSRSLSDPELQARLMKENQILASLNHRNIVRCYEITRSREGLPTIVMEYLKGVDFGAFEGRPFPELLPLMVQASGLGLAYLKERNILHRDLSPNNVFVTIQDDRRPREDPRLRRREGPPGGERRRAERRRVSSSESSPTPRTSSSRSVRSTSEATSTLSASSSSAS